MLPQFEITIDKQDLANLEEVFKDAPHKLNKVLYRGINDATAKMRTHAIHTIVLETGLPKRLVRWRVWAHKANSRNLYGHMRLGKKGWSLMDFRPIQLAEGVEVRVGRRQFVRARSFLASMPHTGEEVWMRRDLGPVPMPRLQKPSAKPRKPSLRRKGRFPILKQHSESPSAIIDRTGAAAGIHEVGTAYLHKRIMAQAELIFTGKRR